jgi:pullulanase/glycogen debranching enzyme
VAFRSASSSTTPSPGERSEPKTPWNRTVIYECHVKGMTVKRIPTCPSITRNVSWARR